MLTTGCATSVRRDVRRAASSSLCMSGGITVGVAATCSALLVPNIRYVRLSVCPFVDSMHVFASSKETYLELRYHCRSGGNGNHFCSSCSRYKVCLTDRPSISYTVHIKTDLLSLFTRVYAP